MHVGQTRDDNGEELDFFEPYNQEIDGLKADLIIAGKEIDDLMGEIKELRAELKLLKTNELMFIVCKHCNEPLCLHISTLRNHGRVIWYCDSSYSTIFDSGK